MAEVIIDAGHGGYDNGAVYNGRREKDDNLALALAVGEILEENGVDVGYTRVEDVYDSPAQKANIANEEGAELFVSIHRNSGANPNTYSGVQSLIYDNSGIKAEAADAINKELEKVGFNNIGTEIRKDLAVLRRTNMDAVLVEAGFINSDNDNRIFDSEFDQIARAIASGIYKTLYNEELPDGSDDVLTPVSIRRERDNDDDDEYFVQTGLYRNYRNAKAQYESLMALRIPAEIDKYEQVYYRVRAGEDLSRREAERLEERLARLGYDTLIVRERD